MNIYLHCMSVLPVLVYGEKKVKDLVVGDKTLCSVGTHFTPIPITQIESEDYGNWFKITYSNGEELIFDREIPFSIGQRFETLSEEEITISSIKNYNKVSKAYKIKLKDSFDDIYINDILIKGTYE